MHSITTSSRVLLATLILAACLTLPARADVISDWNLTAEKIAVDKRMLPPPNARGMAILHVAMFEAVNAIEGRYIPYALKLKADRALSKEAAAAAAAHAVLAALHPDQQASLDAALKTALGAIADGDAKTRAIELGKTAAAEILASRANDGASAPESYRPRAAAGVYVATIVPVSSTYGGVKPWIMEKGSQFRPGAPPALDSATWTADLNEIREVGARNSATRTAEQTAIGRFWFVTGPQAWNPIVRQLVAAKKLEIVDSARLFALTAMAGDDALIAVFEAKYHYNFWRPVTAIRNADITGNAATPRDASWLPLGDTPMHPEYPCAHCITATAVGTVMQKVVGETIPEVSMTSATAPGVVRKWTKVSDYMHEVSVARVYAGFHYRFSAKAGEEMGRRIGDLAVASKLQKPLSIKPLTEKKVTELPAGPLHWRIENFATLAAAQAAAGPWSLVAEAAGKVWLFTLGQPNGSSTAGTKVVELGPVPRITAPQYLLRINEATGPPGSITTVHTHPGSEAFFVLSGEQSIRSAHGVMRVKVGEPAAGHGADVPMQVSSSGETDLHALVMFVVDAARPFSSPATFP
jgi:quercetin dioxygenase-like cupin family protein